MSAVTVAAAFSIALGVLALGAAVVIGLRGRALEADLKRVRGSNDDLRGELTDKERRLHDVETEAAALHADSARKDAALARIGEQAASGVELQKVADALREASGLARDHDREAASRHGAVIKAMRDVNATLKDLRDALESRK